MFGPVVEARQALEAFVGAFDPALVSMSECTDLVEVFGAIERLAGAGRLLAAGRMAEGSSWRVEGDRTAAHWMARKTGSSIGEARAALDTAKRLETLPATEAALRAGKLSGVQVRDVADAASIAPDAEEGLLRTAEREGVGALRVKARAIKVAGSDDAERHRRIYRNRGIEFSTDDEGAFCGRFRTTADMGAELLAAVAPFQQAAFEAARRAGRRDTPEAHALDGLLAMAQAASGAGAGSRQAADDGEHSTPVGPRSLGSMCKVIIGIDYEALVRGHALEGERCELVGVGPIPVSAAKAAMDDAFLAAVITKGVDIKAVAHLGRRATAHQRTALEYRDPTCSVLGCNTSLALEIDHDTGWAITHDTHIDDLNRPCSWHHYLKTVFGYTLEPGVGKRRLLPPANPPPPEALARPHPRRGPPKPQAPDAGAEGRAGSAYAQPRLV
ncbi:MAG TPA: DUF222 domain-containing protein [Acidimicrobiales bacterium]